jgi:NSS family neurotransmitter:Na+ symporter
LSKQKIAFVVCLVGFSAGTIFTTRAGMYFLDIFDHFAINYGLVIVGILECIAVGWILGAEKLRRYINRDSDWKLGKWWSFSIKYLCPIVLIYLVIAQFVADITRNYGGYPDWAMYVGWGIVLVPILVSLAVSFWPKRR